MGALSSCTPSRGAQHGNYLRYAWPFRKRDGRVQTGRCNLSLRRRIPDHRWTQINTDGHGFQEARRGKAKIPKSTSESGREALSPPPPLCASRPDSVAIPMRRDFSLPLLPMSIHGVNRQAADKQMCCSRLSCHPCSLGVPLLPVPNLCLSVSICGPFVGEGRIPASCLSCHPCSLGVPLLPVPNLCLSVSICGPFVGEGRIPASRFPLPASILNTKESER